MTEPALQLPGGEGARKSNLAFALASLPRDRREDALVFYTFCRAVDDIADDPHIPPAEKHAQLARWRTATPEEMPPPFADLIARRHLNLNLLREIVLGVEMDITPRRYETYAELQAYCWRVACAVGLVSIEIFGCEHPDSKIYAEHLGYALQLTNILRDVAEDAALGRIYLPSEDLRRFGVNEESLFERRPDGDFLGLMRFEAARAEGHFRDAEAILPADDRRALAPARIMHSSYHKILRRMTAGGFRVFQQRYRLAWWEKLLLLGRTLSPVR